MQKSDSTRISLPKNIQVRQLIKLKLKNAFVLFSLVKELQKKSVSLLFSGIVNTIDKTQSHQEGF